MAAGLGYIEFATGDVLTAASANGYLASQVVMVFASASARTSAIASPQEGMFSYLKDTNSTEYYSGSAWVAVGGGSSGALTKITSGSFSSVSSFAIDSIFSSTYKNYKLIVIGTGGTGGAAGIEQRFRTAGTDNTTSNYSSGRNSTIYSTGATEIGNSAAANKMQLGRTNGTVFALDLDILNPFASEQTIVIGGHTDSSRGGASSGLFGATTSFDGIKIINEASNNITGTYIVYGYGD